MVELLKLVLGFIYGDGPIVFLFYIANIVLETDNSFSVKYTSIRAHC